MKRMTTIVAALALAVAACTASQPAEDHGDRHTQPEPTWDVARVVDVNLYEWGIDYLSEPFEEGEEITFRVLNAGLTPHEFEVTGAHAIEEHLEGGHDGHGDMDMGDKLVLDVGEQGELTVTITDETNIAACLIPGHYEAGMWIGLTDHVGHDA